MDEYMNTSETKQNKLGEWMCWNEWISWGVNVWMSVGTLVQRKKHYNEFQAVKMARALMQEDEEEEEEVNTYIDR